MEETKCSCPQCEARAKEEAVNEELNFAILLALIPALVITLFGNMGLL